MSSSYQFQGGEYQTVDQVDVLPEQEAVNAKIERSENEYFDSLRQNDRNRVNDSIAFWKEAGKLSKSAQGVADKLYEDQKEADMARGAIAAMNSPLDYEGLQILLNEEEDMKRQDVQLAGIGKEIENETGSYILGKEIRNMSGWERYSFVKNILLREGKDYKKYKLTAKQTAIITVDNGEGDEVVSYSGAEGTRKPQNSAEADALDAKIRGDFAARFKGINPTLIQATIKEQVDNVDNADKNARDQEFERVAKERDELNQRLDIIDNIRANPADGRATVEHEVEILAVKYDGDVSLARMELADILVKAVGEGELSLTEAIATVQHAIPYRGSKKDEDMEIFKEWRTLRTRLMEANNEFRTRQKGVDKDAMLARIDEFKKVQNPTVETRAAFIRGLRKDFPDMAIPEEGYNIVYGYKDDDAMTQTLKRVRFNNDGVIPERYMEGASPDVYELFKNDIVPNDQKRISSVSELGTDTQKFLRNRIANATNLELGDGKATTLEYDTMLEVAQAEFIADYNAALIAGEDPRNALKLAKDNLVRNVENDQWRKRAAKYNYTESDKDRQKALVRAQKQIKPATGNWRTMTLEVPDAEKEELQAWAESGGKGPVPSYYNAIAFNNGIYAKELASAQAQLFGFKAPIIDSKAIEKIPPSVLPFLIKATPVRIGIAKKEMENVENENNEEYVPAWKQNANLREGL